MSDTILKLRLVQAKVGMGHSAIYSKINSGEFPAPIKLGERAVGWLQSEVDAWIASRKAERDRERAMPFADPGKSSARRNLDRKSPSG